MAHDRASAAILKKENSGLSEAINVSILEKYDWEH